METTTGVAGSFITTVLVVQSSDSGSVLAFCSFLLRVQFDLLATPYTSLSPACHVRFWRVWFREADPERGIGRVAGLDSCGTDRHDSSTQWPTHSSASADYEMCATVAKEDDALVSCELIAALLCHATKNDKQEQCKEHVLGVPCLLLFSACHHHILGCPA